MPDKHDYYPLIARAVAGLGGGTPDSCQDVYERARASQVKNIDPARFPPAITREREADWLQSARLFLWNFLAGVGGEPVPFKGLDTSRLGDKPTDVETLRRIMASPEYQRDFERPSHLMAIAEKQDKEVEKRIDNALRIRSLRLAGLERAALDEQGGSAPTS